jgi:site-specific recombinase XerD
MSAGFVSLQVLVQRFFEQHLTVERCASSNTVLAYRDALKLFLAHTSSCLGCSPDRLDHSVLDVALVRSFLDGLSKERACGPRTRNQRLAAIKTFARYVASVAPEHLDRCRQIRELLPARFDHPEVGYLEDDEILRLVRASNSHPTRRDRALLLLLYNTGARVQELVDLNIGDVHLDPVPHVVIIGKGRKQRTCPLWARTIEAIRAWLAERQPEPRPIAALFVNTRGGRLSRSGVADILRRLTKRAEVSPQHAHRVTPHVIRHTTAMHLLQSGVDITTIAAWLGHAQLSTTHGYVEIDLRMKQAAVALDAGLPEINCGPFPTGDLLTWLAGLGRSAIMCRPRSETSTKFRRRKPSST